MREELTVFVADPHAIFRRGVAECLRALPAVTGFAEAATVAQAREDPGLAAAGVLLVDPQLDDAAELIAEVTGAGTPVIACVTADGDIAPALGAGAIGILHKSSMTPAMLTAGVQAAAGGLAVVAPELLDVVVRPPRASRAARPAGRWLTTREQRVLMLLADGHATREVAARLSYSERTVKNVLHDAVTKLGARSRSEAIAQAVREGLI